MARFLGSFMDDNELDRPDLNKCPDCECFFPQDNCPICGKLCPEEMRAGNRKKQKKKSARNGKSKAVAYVDWYHKWWFIILMLFIFPIVGIILLASSPHKKGAKIAVIVVAVLYMILSYFGIGTIKAQLEAIFEKPVDTSLSYNEYLDKCEVLYGEDYYRQADNYKGDFAKIILTVKEKFIDVEGYYNKGKYTEYYVCEYLAEGSTFDIIIRDCAKNNKKLINGDIITVYGECAGNIQILDMEYKAREGACINARYITLVN